MISWMCSIYIYIYIHTYIHACIHAYIHTCIHTYIHTYMHACMHAYIHTYTHTYIHTYVRTYVRTYVHTYIHTYIYLYTMIYYTIRRVPRAPEAAEPGPVELGGGAPEGSRRSRTRGPSVSSRGRFVDWCSSGVRWSSGAKTSGNTERNKYCIFLTSRQEPNNIRRLS